MCNDRNCNFSGAATADIQSNRRIDTLDLIVLHTALHQALYPPVVVATAAECTNVEGG